MNLFDYSDEEEKIAFRLPGGFKKWGSYREYAIWFKEIKNLDLTKFKKVPPDDVDKKYYILKDGKRVNHKTLCSVYDCMFEIDEKSEE